MKRVLGNKVFMATFVADMLSNFGDVLYYLALMNYILLLPEATFAISLVTLSETLPFLTMLVMGMWGDRTKNKIDTILMTLIFRVGLYVLVGFILGFPPALWIVIVAIVVNILSDLAGQYENALYTPVSLRVVPDQDREGMYAFRQAAKSILQIIFQSSGAVLISLMTYQELAFLNAGTFLVATVIVLILRPSLDKLLKANPVAQSEPEEKRSNFFKQSWQSLKSSYQAVKNLPLLKNSIISIALLNAIFSAMGPLMLLNINHFPGFVLVNPATTLAAMSIIMLLGNLAGSILGTTVFKQLSFESLIRLSTLFPVILFTGFLMHNVYLVLAVLFATMTTVGIFNPKMNAYVMRSLPEDKLATIGAGIDTFCTIGFVLSQLLLSGLVVILSAELISILFLVGAVFLFTLTLKNSQ